MSAHFESAISRLRPTSERRSRTTAVATLAAAQNGTYGPVVIAGRGSVGCGSPLPAFGERYYAAPLNW